MNEILRKIVDIDEQTKELIEQTEVVMNSERDNVKKVLQSLDEKYLEQMKTEATYEYEKTIENGKKTIESINHKKANELKSLEEIYESKKEALVKEVVSEILKEGI